MLPANAEQSVSFPPLGEREKVQYWSRSGGYEGPGSEMQIESTREGNEKNGREAVSQKNHGKIEKRNRNNTPMTAEWWIKHHPGRAADICYANRSAGVTQRCCTASCGVKT